MSHAKARKKHAAHEEEAHADERWLVTYADMLTLLMVLFIVMFAISQVDKKKFAMFSGGIAKSFGGTMQMIEGGPTVIDDDSDGPAAPSLASDAGGPPSRSGGQNTAAGSSTDTKAKMAAMAAAKREAADLKKAHDAITAALKRKGLRNSVQFRVDQRGMEISIITDKVLFPADRADLQPFGRVLLDAVAPALQVLPNDLTVEGHTNTAPVKPRFYPSEWELSSARAVSVVRYLIDRDHLGARRMSATGFADQHPLYPGDSPRANVLNRRVDIVVLSQLSDASRQYLPQMTRAWARS